MTRYQNDVCDEIKEMARVGMVGLVKAQAAIKVVKANAEDTFTEWSGMNASEAAELAVELA